MSLEIFVCQNNIKFQQKQPVLGYGGLEVS